MTRNRLDKLVYLTRIVRDKEPCVAPISRDFPDEHDVLVAACIVAKKAGGVDVKVQNK